MRRVVLALIGIFSFVLALETQASEGELKKITLEDVESFLSPKSDVNNTTTTLDNLNKVLGHLSSRQEQYKNEVDFIDYLYYYTHRKLLKRYTKYPSIEETLLYGDYDCLTATAVYSLILEELKINHAIVETTYHIYILVNPDTPREILIESTDPRNGLLVNKDDIREAKSTYSKASSASGKALIDFGLVIERKLLDKELIGLLYYNQSIRALNNGNWREAQNFAYAALQYYPNERVTLLINTLESSYSATSL